MGRGFSQNTDLQKLWQCTKIFCVIRNVDVAMKYDVNFIRETNNALFGKIWEKIANLKQIYDEKFSYDQKVVGIYRLKN